MTNLSPAAQAVVNAVDHYETNHWLTPREVAAAALQSAQDHARTVCRPGPQGCGPRYGNGNPPTLEDAYECGFFDAVAIYSLILDRISRELEAQP